MNGKEIFELMSQDKMPKRIPFVPTIYEHSAKLIEVFPSEMAKNYKLIAKGQLKAYELYEHDLISVGIDIYNIEAEAFGMKVEYHDNDELPSLKGYLIKNMDEIYDLKIPDPEKDSRMPMMLEASKIVKDEVGKFVPVSGTVVGPFTLAAILRGFENFLIDLLTEPEKAKKLLEICMQAGVAFAKSYIDRGLDVAINESWIAPPLLSPDMYKNFAYNIERKMIKEIKDYGQKNVALICGGNTSNIASDMLKTGTSLIMADYGSKLEYYKKLCIKKSVIIRGSIQSKTVKQGNVSDMYNESKKVINVLEDYNKFIFGCGIVSYDTKPENLLELKKIVNKINSR